MGDQNIVHAGLVGPPSSDGEPCGILQPFEVPFRDDIEDECSGEMHPALIGGMRRLHIPDVIFPSSIDKAVCDGFPRHSVGFDHLSLDKRGNGGIDVGLRVLSLLSLIEMRQYQRGGIDAFRDTFEYLLFECVQRFEYHVSTREVPRVRMYHIHVLRKGPVNGKML